MQAFLFRKTSIIDTRESDSYFIVKQIITINYIRQELHDLVHSQLLLYRLIGLFNCFNIRRHAYNIHYLQYTYSMNLYININSHWSFFQYKLKLSQLIIKIYIYILMFICVMIIISLYSQYMCVYLVSIVIVCVLIIRKPLLLYVTLIRRANKVTFLTYLIHIPDWMSHALITSQCQGNSIYELTDIMVIISISFRFLIYVENSLYPIILYFIYFCLWLIWTTWHCMWQWSRRILLFIYLSVLIVGGFHEQCIIHDTINLNKYAVFIYCILYVHVCISLVSSQYKAQYYHRLIGHG